MTSLLFEYSESYFPSAPVAEVTISSDAGTSKDVVGIIDSGADATLVPT